MSDLQIVLRASWGAAAPTGQLDAWPVGQPTGHTQHWEGAGGHLDHSQCAAEVRSIQAYHQTHGYFDIAYNWIVCPHGVIYQGRPVGQFRSAAQKDGNPLRVAICYMAGPQIPFTDAAKHACAWLFTINAPPYVIPHADEPSCSTSCAGDTINQWVRSGAWKSAVPVATPGPSPAPSPPPPAGYNHPTLSQGAVGPAVTELQFKLIYAFGQHIVADGKFGPLTKQAVENAQRWGHLVVDGIVGPKTWGLLDYFTWYHYYHH